MSAFTTTPANLSGSVLAAHPGLNDPNFRRSVVLISSHTAEGGAMGTILNRPMRKTLGELNPVFESRPLGSVPLYSGGPVAPDELLLMAWKWSAEDGVFRLAYGLNPEQARQHLEEEGYALRAFLGYAGWGQGQLENEIDFESWLVSGMEVEHLRADGPRLWREILSRFGERMRLEAEAPEDPGLN